MLAQPLHVVMGSFTIRLNNAGREHTFTGELLADESNREDDETRWTEVRIWRTDDRQYVVQRTVRSAHPGEEDRFSGAVLERPHKVKWALRWGKTYLTDLALDALDQAGTRDPELAAASVERI
jgi:EXLDI family protein